uniref:Pentraxin 4 n=1 Tax=Sarcophilus harrisii TaxID=9305 RepID=A0A7N4V7A2_SARHA
MGCWEAKCMSLFLVLITFYLQGTYLQKADESRQRKPFFERLRRLEEQFRRFQEVTLTRLQGIAKNYNVSYNINTRFQNLTDEHHTLAMSVSETQAAVQMDLNHLKAWMKKIQRRSRKFAMGPCLFSPTLLLRMWSSSVQVSSLGSGSYLSVLGSGPPPATWVPYFPMPLKKMTTSWCCTVKTPWFMALSTL